MKLRNIAIATVLVLACAGPVRAQIYYEPSPDDQIRQQMRDRAEAQRWQEQRQLEQEQNQILRQMEQNQRSFGFQPVPPPAPAYPPPMGFGGMR